MKIIFWLFFFTVFYHYFIFPFVTIFYAMLKRKNIKKGKIIPRVSLVIAAYNEERCIDKKIKNSFNLNYPEENLEIIIVSDGSTDRTPEIVDNYNSKGVINLYSPPRRGKTSALNRAVEKASGEILVFSDANSMYKPDAIMKLIRNFSDPTVGGVCGRKSVAKNTKRESSKGDSFFWKIESFLKKQQSNAGSIATADGEIFAIRKELYEKLPVTIINDDAAITFKIIEKGYRVVYEDEAVSIEEASIVLKDDFNVKVRMVAGGYQTLEYYGNIIFPPTTYFAVQFISHKIMRWIMPFLLLALFLSNVFVLKGLYGIFFILQTAFYGLAITGFIMKKRRPTQSTVHWIFYMPLYYCTMNIAALKGFFVFLKKQSVDVIWKKAER